MCEQRAAGVSGENWAVLVPAEQSWQGGDDSWAQLDSLLHTKSFFKNLSLFLIGG